MNVAVLGNGQLGMMLQRAGGRIGIDVQLLDIDTGILPQAVTPISAEREHWPDNSWTAALQGHPGWLNREAFFHLSDRTRQKAFIARLGLATAPWRKVGEGTLQDTLHQELGPDVFLKSARGGYDGRGQMRVRQGSEVELPAWADGALAEQAIPFDAEVSIIGARGRDGQTRFYRLTENRHVDGVLAASISLPVRSHALQLQAENMLQVVMASLGYVGVMAIEFFVVDGALLINEIAPRVHNSGHWTQAGASICQFEMHLRAVCGLPLPVPEQPGASMMLNLVGQPYDAAWLSHGAAQLHWYGKTWRPGRKMGHVNFFHPESEELAVWLEAMPLPAGLEGSRAWALSRLVPDAIEEEARG